MLLQQVLTGEIPSLLHWRNRKFPQAHIPTLRLSQEYILILESQGRLRQPTDTPAANQSHSLKVPSFSRDGVIASSDANPTAQWPPTW